MEKKYTNYNKPQLDTEPVEVYEEVEKAEEPVRPKDLMMDAKDVPKVKGALGLVEGDEIEFNYIRKEIGGIIMRPKRRNKLDRGFGVVVGFDEEFIKVQIETSDGPFIGFVDPKSVY